jgi:8-oxo-dGTP pyrophosphatase MutT (NUDIX family)
LGAGSVSKKKERFNMDYWHRIRQAIGKETVIIPSVAGAIIHEGKILLVRHKLLQKWQIPGGLQETGESIQETVKREIKEELNLDLVTGSLIGVYSHPKWIIEFPDESKI